MKKIAILALTSVLFLGVFGTVSAASNTMVIEEKGGVTTSNYPMQFARPFTQGEIYSYPQVLLDGTPLTTQADVKQRYSDGSVKHAIISFLIPNLVANSVHTITFRAQATGNNTPLSTFDMLDSKYNFDAVIKMATTSSATRSASARNMLESGDYEYWTKGPIATTIILTDHSVDRAYDMGFDEYRSVRPIFHATFWPTINKVRVRYIGEIINTEYLQDQFYDLSLSLGMSNPQIVYTNDNLPHLGGTRWTKVYWEGGEPNQKVNIDNNLGYLAATKFIPNYDTSITISESSIANNYSSWLSKPRDLYQTGGMVKRMPNTGGRGDLGLFPTWVSRWFYTGDWRHREEALKKADLGGAWGGLHRREGDSAKYIDETQTIPNLGKVMSINARPSLWLDNRDKSNVEDTIVNVGNILDSKWVADDDHQPELYSGPYMLTGDYWYLEQLQQWAATTVFFICSNCRGGDGYAGVSGQVRGQAWTLRTRVNAAFLTPDNTPEKSYFKMLVDDAIAVWDRKHKIYDSKLMSLPRYNFTINESIVLSPIHHWDDGQANLRDGLDKSLVSTGLSPWMEYFLLSSLGYAKEKGFESGPLLKWYSEVLTRQVKEYYQGKYNGYLIGLYRHPVKKTDSTFFSTYEETMPVFPLEKQEKTSMGASSADSYTVYATAAASFLTEEDYGAETWGFLKQNIYDVYKNSIYKSDPRWAILPRTEVAYVPPPTPIPTYTPPVCGNSIIETGEVCDSGSNNGTAGYCSATCDSILPIPEPTPEPTPTPTPTPEPTPTQEPDPTPTQTTSTGGGGGGTSTPAPTQPSPICGNQIKESGEFCDSGQYNGIIGYCNLSCSALVQLAEVVTTPENTTQTNITSNSGGSGGGGGGGTIFTSTNKTTPSTSTSNCIPTKTTTGTIIFTHNLWYGLKNSDITTLQQLLAKDPLIYPENIISGYYGILTRKAVERFQIKHGVVSGGTPGTTGFGVVGPKTRAKLNEVYGGTTSSLDTCSETVTKQTTVSSFKFTSNLWRGLTNSDVVQLQKLLAQDKSIYPENITSGYYGSLTQKAVERFQIKYGIVSSGSPLTNGFGVVGPKTRAVLNSVYGL